MNKIYWHFYKIVMNELVLTSLSNSSISTPNNTEISMNDIFFPYNKNFIEKTQKEKEQLFLKQYETQLNSIRNKELRCETSLGQTPINQEALTFIFNNRKKFYNNLQIKEQRNIINCQETLFNSNPAPRINNSKQPTFNSLLNIYFDSQISLIDKFKSSLTILLIRNRVKTRCQQITQNLLNKNII